MIRNVLALVVFASLFTFGMGGCAVETGEPEPVVEPTAESEAAARKQCPLPSCAAPPPGCRYQGMVTFPCSKVTCGSLVCTDPLE